MQISAWFTFEAWWEQWSKKEETDESAHLRGRYECWRLINVSKCCRWGTHLFEGPLRGQSIVTMPCPLPGDIHHRGGADSTPSSLSKPQRRPLMRVRLLHPSGPYGDQSLNTVRDRRDHTWTPPHTNTVQPNLNQIRSSYQLDSVEGIALLFHNR